MHKAKVLMIATAATLAVACATDDPNKRTKTGAAIGAIAGAVVGSYMDKQQAKLNQELAAESRNNEITVTRVDKETLKINVSSETSFDHNSAGIKPSFRNSLQKVGDVIAEYNSTAVHVIGHTDSTGSDSYNQQLSEKRASAVSRHLSRNGVDRTRMRMSGRGENQPVSDNASSAGRSDNRRVEIYLKSIVEGRENDAYRPPR